MTYNAHVIILCFVRLLLRSSEAADGGRRTMGLIRWHSWTPHCRVDQYNLHFFFVCTLWLRLAGSATSANSATFCDATTVAVVVAPFTGFVALVFSPLSFLSFSVLVCMAAEGKRSKCTERAMRAMQTKPFYVHKNLQWPELANGTHIIVCAIHVYRMA